ncbi:FRG domain-containing protein [Enterobacter hormaechei]|uniref:FRG domain-containing protein n=1 Tax=Enterobacter hormaechei TaxID=158836 RepID=UPI001923EC8B|nr:FRG domain-containing protein [Enterobacter hormaechei]QQW41263.1 FRG domain-containing protein [Enterobacter hormaechei]
MNKPINPLFEYTVKSWSEIWELATYFADDMGFIFRGQRCSSWTLETSLDRHLKRIKPEEINLDSTYDFVLQNFALSLRGRSDIDKDHISNIDELWALGQHYGLATPLLDWTRSLFVALYFAFEDYNISDSGYRSVWALNLSGTVLNAMNKFNEGKEENKQFRIVEPISDKNPRLISQSGLFTKQPINFSIPDWVKDNLPDDAPYLMKISINESERMKILSSLKLMNIHPASLFPEPDGAAKYCNQLLELLSHKNNTSLFEKKNQKDK